MTDERGYRYETCVWCGARYNVARKQKVPEGGYICPPCWFRGRREPPKHKKEENNENDQRSGSV